MLAFSSVKTCTLHFVLYSFLSEISRALFAKTNGSITLKTNKQQIQEILWKCDGHKIVDWDMNSNPIEFRQFKGRTALIPDTGDLTISGLKVEDSGAYEAEAVIDGIIHSVKHKVEIIDPVSKPIITCMTSNGTSVLHCQAEGPHLRYSWSGPGLTTEINGQIGPNISKVETNSVNTCVVKNPVSEEAEQFQAADCFPEEEKPGLSGTIITLLAILSVLLLALAVASVVLYVLKRRIPKVKSNPEEMNRVDEKKDGQEGQESVIEVPCERERGGEQTEVKSLLDDCSTIMDSPSMQRSGIPPYCLE